MPIIRTPRPSIAYATLARKARTGDIIVFAGTMPHSVALEKKLRSQFSHASMIVRPNPTGPIYLWQTGPSPITTDKFTGTSHGGAQLGALEPTLRVMAAPDYGDPGFYRQLKVARGPQFESAMMMFVQDMNGRPFPTVARMTKAFASGRKMKSFSDRTLYCAELVAETYMRLGLLLMSPPPNSYIPAHFTDERKITLQKQATFGPLLSIALSK
jgi:hypothetical protein